MADRELSAGERAELDRLRHEQSRSARWGRRGRWVGAGVILLVSALLGTLGVVAVYLRSEVLNTDTYVQTVAPLAQDPTVRSAVANRLATELVARADVQGLANTAAQQLEARGAPARLTDLVGPVVNGLTSFLSDKINDLLATQQFERAWENVNRLAHESLVTVLTGGETDVISSQGTTVTIDLGELLSLAKQQLVAQGFTLVSRVPDVSIPYTLVQSDELPTVRTYTRLLNAAGTWLPWLSLALLAAGVWIAPNRRRGVITGAVMLAGVVGLLLFGMNEARTYYLDRLPPSIASPDAVAIIYDTVTRFLVAELQTLLVAALIVVVAAVLAGPSRPAVLVRRLLNRGLDAGAAALARAGGWVAATGRTLGGVHHLIQIGIVALAAVGLVLAQRPGIGVVCWVTAVVLVLLVALEVFIRSAAGGSGGGQPLATA